MTQNPCWQDTNALHILKIDAEEISDHVFRAVHSSTDLVIADVADGEGRVETAEQFITRFLDPNRTYVQAVVRGQSGTGKSHLIQWLRLNIPKDSRTVLITIPKLGTSLRGIVERIIAQLPMEERAPYEDRLRSAGTQSVDHAAKISKLLVSLAWAIEYGQATDEADQDLSSELPHVLQDPNLRNGFFLREGNTIDDIVKHIFVDPKDRNGNEIRREFVLGDLPLDGRLFRDSSQLAQGAIDFIKGEPGMDARAIRLMNSCLDAAIAQTLNFSADNLIDLMNALRRHLARQGMRLILLIEDFARLQGIDTAMLQALITPPGQGDDQLCEIRWAMAVTTGYFQRLDATVTSRSTMVVDMDRTRPASLASWTAGYLNALRTGYDGLLKIPTTDEVPSACSNCEVRTSCLLAFGSVGEIGLFPFTQSSIQIMAERSESLAGSGSFNPRRFMQTVLQNVLVSDYNSLKQGEFPTSTLLSAIGGRNKLKSLDKQALSQEDPIHHARRVTLLELWNGTENVVNLDPGIHDAFGIPLLKDIPTVTEAQQQTHAPRNTGSTVEELPAEVAMLRRWANDEKVLPTTEVLKLRELVFGALELFIDWDDIGIKKSLAASSAGGSNNVPFRVLSIAFTDQQTQETNATVKLRIGRDAVLALEALLWNSHYGNWMFPEGEIYLANLLEALHVWGPIVTQQIRIWYHGDSDWALPTACTELLMTALLQSGRVKIGASTMDTLIERMWEFNLPEPPKYIHAPLRKSSAQLSASWKKTMDMLRAVSSGTKGGQVGNFVRVTPVIKAMKAFRQSSMNFSQKPPKGTAFRELEDIVILYESFQLQLRNLLEVERAEWRTWMTEMEAYLPAGTQAAVLIKACKDVGSLIATAGVSTGGTLGRLDVVLGNLNVQTLERSLDHIRAVPNSNDFDTLVRLASISIDRDEISGLVQLIDRLLIQTTAAVDTERDNIDEATGSGLRESEGRIEQALEQLGGIFEDFLQLQEVEP